MSYEALLTDQCDVYHLAETAGEVQYGVQSSSKFGYAETPDLADMPCLFVDVGLQQTATQAEPNMVVSQTKRIHFLIDADVRMNSKVLFAGVAYRLGEPRPIRNHHIEVMATRMVAADGPF